MFKVPPLNLLMKTLGPVSKEREIAAIVLFICISVHGYIPFFVPSSHENYIMGSEKKNSWMAPSSGEAVPYMT